MIDPNAPAHVSVIDLQAQIAALPAPVDLGPINAAIAALTARVTKLETAPTPAPTPVDRPPVWTTVPAITFTQGKAGTFSILPFVSDPDNDPLTITKNTALLPAGVTYAAGVFTYDGVGAASSTPEHFLIADDGRS